MTRVPPRGFTLIELLVALAIMGVILGVATLAFRRIEQPVPSDPYVMIGDSLRAAVATGRTMTLRFVVRGQSAAATLFPDGSIVSDSILGIDRLIGRTPNDR
jgi:prepilin-type N-terminal cleavage/methylation domain-containing protein